jgi:predicted metalloprotease with PDZ domain
MKKYIFSFFAFAIFGNAFAQPNLFKDAQQHFLANIQNANYQFSLDLTKVHDDMLTVNLVTPLMSTDTVLYRMPAIVPGTYKVYNFGKFVSNFKAMDKTGKEISVIKMDANTWKIPDAKNLNRISYDVEDTWDSKQEGETVFEPAGTNFQADTNFVLNNHAIFGYFEGMKKNNYILNITHPTGFYGATGLTDVKRDGNLDHYVVPDYMQLVDGPIMYDIPDTTHLYVGGADILISVYSPKKLVTSKFVSDSLRVLLDLQRQYLGGTLPVKNYCFIIYLNNKNYQSNAFGALEHSYSSMYTLLEMKPALIAQTVKDVSAHEFFHIVTPLSIHSEEIGNFDYNKPKMSQHLWMYEGLTEYAAHHVQIKYGTLSLNDYLKEVHNEMDAADDFTDDLSFTEMSKNCLDKYEDQYDNVYQKGALIGLCLDIKLRQLSEGKYGTQDLMRDLAKKYGKEKSFIDDSLFSDIVKLTYPEIGDFFKKYVIGGDPLPFEEIFATVGVEYKPRAKVMVLDALGGYGVRLDQNANIRLWPEQTNPFSTEMDYQKGDMLLSFNGIKITAENANSVIADFNAQAKEGQEIVVKIKRLHNGKWKKKTLKGKMHYVPSIEHNVLTPMENPTPEQLKIRKAWINK